MTVTYDDDLSPRAGRLARLAEWERRGWLDTRTVVGPQRLRDGRWRTERTRYYHVKGYTFSECFTGDISDETFTKVYLAILGQGGE